MNSRVCAKSLALSYVTSFPTSLSLLQDGLLHHAMAQSGLVDHHDHFNHGSAEIKAVTEDMSVIEENRKSSKERSQDKVSDDAECFRATSATSGGDQQATAASAAGAAEKAAATGGGNSQVSRQRKSRWVLDNCQVKMSRPIKFKCKYPGVGNVARPS